MREGWKCPVCGRGVSPDEKYCEHSSCRSLCSEPRIYPSTTVVPWNPSVPITLTTCMAGGLIWNQ